MISPRAGKKGVCGSELSNAGTPFRLGSSWTCFLVAPDVHECDIHCCCGRNAQDTPYCLSLLPSLGHDGSKLIEDTSYKHTTDFGNFFFCTSLLLYAGAVGRGERPLQLYFVDLGTGSDSPYYVKEILKRSGSQADRLVCILLISHLLNWSAPIREGALLLYKRTHRLQ